LNKRIQVVLDWKDIRHEIQKIDPFLLLGIEEQKSRIIVVCVSKPHVEGITNIDIDACPKDVDELRHV
jgi:hypothetical protein